MDNTWKDRRVVRTDHRLVGRVVAVRFSEYQPTDERAAAEVARKDADPWADYGQFVLVYDDGTEVTLHPTGYEADGIAVSQRERPKS